MIYEMNQGSKKLFSSSFRSLLVKKINDVQILKSVIEERKKFFKRNWNLEIARLGNFNNYQIKLLAEASVLIELYGHIRFDIKSDNWLSESRKSVTELYPDGTELQSWSELSYDEILEFKKKQKGIANFMTEFEFAVPPTALIADESGEIVERLDDVSNLDIDIRVGKVRLSLPRQLNQKFVIDLFELIGDFNQWAIPPDLKVTSSKKPTLYAFYTKVLKELLPFIESNVILETDKSPSNTRFLAGLVFASINQLIERSVYENPVSRRTKYKKGRGTSTIDYYSYVAKTIRNYSTR